MDPTIAAGALIGGGLLLGGGAIGAMHRLGERVGCLPTHFRRRVVQVLGDLLDELGILEPPERPKAA